MTESPLVDLGFVVYVFSPGDDPIACLNKAMAFLTVVASSRFPSTNNQLRTSSNLRNQATIQDGRVIVQQVQGDKVKVILVLGEGHMARQCTQPKRSRNATWYKEKSMLAEAQEAGQILDEEQLAFLADPGVPDGQSVQTIIMILTMMISRMLKRFSWPTFPTMVLTLSQRYLILKPIIMIWKIKANKEQNSESVTAELEKYKEQVKTLEQRLNIDLSSREKMIDSQMDDMIKEKLALKEQVDSLEQNLSIQIKEKEGLLQTFTVFKSESKEKEDKYIENKIDLEKKIKELDNIIFKVGQSAQTVHMLTKPQAFYNNIHKQALGYQNPFYLRKTQRIKPTLYDGIVISDKHVAMLVIDDEETLILEEKKLSDDFRKRFTPQQEMDVEQAFWLRISNPTSKPSNASLVKIEAPKELPKVSLVNESLKKLKFHLARFDNVVKIKTTPDARTESEWGFKHTKVVFNNEIIPFLKYLKDIFNVFDRDLLNEVMEVQAIFNQMDATVQ
ncbi:hypothetical protein Tco_0547599 [Tanacetum coccineum]